MRKKLEMPGLVWLVATVMALKTELLALAGVE